MSEKAGKKIGLPTGIALGSGVIDAYSGWVGTVAVKVDLGVSLSEASTERVDISQALGRLTAVAGTSTCHLAISKE